MTRWVLLVCLLGCAHVTNVAKSCLVTEDAVAVVSDVLELGSYKEVLAALVVDKGLCLVRASVAEWRHRHDTPVKAAMGLFAEPSDLEVKLGRADAWLAEHP